MMKRTFDVIVSLMGLLVLWPLFVFIAILIVFDSKGGVFYRQERVGLHGKSFQLLKFRTMRPASETKGLLTVGSRDPRVTSIGYVLRKYKLDELPQLLNVLKGDMSLVGPRPEVRKYVDMYTSEQRKILEIRPGITDYASLEYIDENELLGQSEDPENTYIEEIMPAKLKLNQKYLQDIGWWTDVRILVRTVLRIIR